MKVPTIFSMHVLILMLFAMSAFAQRDRFVGNFVAQDTETGGITRLSLSPDDEINIWGRCNPADCDWGPENIVAYGPNVTADTRTSANAVTAIYQLGYATKIVIIEPMKNERLRVDVFTWFNDGSGRAPFKVSQIMVREVTTPRTRN